MAEPLDYRAKLNSKGMDGTGVTTAHAKTMSRRLGGHTLLIVEVEHARLITDADGAHQVQLAVTTCEPVPEHLEETVRRFQRALYMTRPDVQGQAVLSGTADGESPDEAAAGLDAVVQTGEDGEPAGVWDGNPEEPLDGSEERRLAAVPDPPADGEDACAFPGCARVEHEDGDHMTADGAVIDPEAVEQ
jgi:hypothetical protein